MRTETTKAGNPSGEPARKNLANRSDPEVLENRRLLKEGEWEGDGKHGYRRLLTDDDGNIREQGVFRSSEENIWWLITEWDSASKETSHKTLTGALNAAEGRKGHSPPPGEHSSTVKKRGCAPGL